MTVSASYAPLVSAGNDVTVAFSPTWVFFSSAEIKVTLIDSDGVETVKSLTTHYTVSGGADSDGLPSTGTITMLTAPATGETLVIERVTTNTQATSYANNDAFGAKTHEAAYDRRTLVEQEAKEIAGRSLQANPKLTLTGRNFKVDGTGWLKWDDTYGFSVETAVGDGDMLASAYDPAGIEEQLVGLTANQTLTNKTLRAVDGSAEAPSIGFTSDTDNGLYRSGTNLWHLVGGGTALLSVDGVNGRIGIGTTSPGSKLEVSGADIHINNSTSDAYLYMGSTKTGGRFRWDNNNGKLYSGVNADHVVITSAGDVGIGTVTPGCKLDVDGVIRPKTYTVATLPTIVTGGILYASDGRKAGEGGGAGTGVLVFADGSNWIAVDTGATVAA